MTLGSLLKLKSSIKNNEEKLNNFLHNTLHSAATRGQYDYETNIENLATFFCNRYTEFDLKKLDGYKFIISWENAKSGEALKLKEIADLINSDNEWLLENKEKIKQSIIHSIEKSKDRLIEIAEHGGTKAKITTHDLTVEDIRRINNSAFSQELYSKLLPDLWVILTVTDDIPLICVHWYDIKLLSE